MPSMFVVTKKETAEISLTRSRVRSTIELVSLHISDLLKRDFRDGGKVVITQEVIDKFFKTSSSKYKGDLTKREWELLIGYFQTSGWSIAQAGDIGSPEFGLTFS